ncbi:hypothetical protein EHS25_001548 [Saitozyma podzolica]|uniref:RRM domain-containing protein n=1 Tax=Saitozyma podzolica TaxID=1890683 RepID=A0A427YGZ9_9TREE|nr:hypothetical protein EHS25_001548 [Saitozyma podzolica]
MSNRTVLYVSGFGSSLRARDLAYEFERYGRLVRCDIPALKSPTSSPFAFIEFRRELDAEDAYYDMHGRSIDGRRITVQWAKRPPSNAWRHDGYGDRRDRDRDSDRRDRRSPPRRRSPSPRRDRDDRDARDARGADREHDRRRSLSPRRDDRDHPARAQSPPAPAEEDRERIRSPVKEANGNGHDHIDGGEDERERRED